MPCPQGFPRIVAGDEVAVVAPSGSSYATKAIGGRRCGVETGLGRWEEIGVESGAGLQREIESGRRGLEGLLTVTTTMTKTKRSL